MKVSELTPKIFRPVGLEIKLESLQGLKEFHEAMCALLDADLFEEVIDPIVSALDKIRAKQEMKVSKLVDPKVYTPLLNPEFTPIFLGIKLENLHEVEELRTAIFLLDNNLRTKATTSLFNILNQIYEEQKK